MSLSTNEPPEQAFWQWFEKNQDDLFHFERNRDAVFNRLFHVLKEVDEDLTFEFSPVRDNGIREFVISAGGIQTAFPSVESLHAAAPQLPKWQFFKYRQRRSPLNDLNFAGRHVKATDVHYFLSADENSGKLDIVIFLDGYDAKEKMTIWDHIGYLFLDEALGEYDVETSLGVIKFSDRHSKSFKHARPLGDLPAHFDKLLAMTPEKARAALAATWPYFAD